MANKVEAKYKRVPVEKYSAMMNIINALAEQKAIENEMLAAKAKLKKKPINRERAQLLFSDIGSLMYTLRDIAENHMEGDESAHMVQIIAEKAGWLSDEGAKLVDGTPVCGGFASWAGIEKQEIKA